MNIGIHGEHAHRVAAADRHVEPGAIQYGVAGDLDSAGERDRAAGSERDGPPAASAARKAASVELVTTGGVKVSAAIALVTLPTVLVTTTE